MNVTAADQLSHNFCSVLAISYRDLLLSKLLGISNIKNDFHPFCNKLTWLNKKVVKPPPSAG